MYLINQHNQDIHPDRVDNRGMLKAVFEDVDELVDVDVDIRPVLNDVVDLSEHSTLRLYILCHGEVVYFRNCLFYCGQFTKTQVKSALVGFYTEDELISGKDVLHGHLTELVTSSSLGCVVPRCVKRPANDNCMKMTADDLW